MRLFDADDSQQNLIDDTPVFDKTATGERLANTNFDGFKL
jgi:hypothetical protein